MGVYISPAKETKEAWLDKHASLIGFRGIEQTKVPSFAELEANEQCLVVLINNGRWTAAVVAYNEPEYDTWTSMEDNRPMIYYKASKSVLSQVCPGYESYFEMR